MEKEKNEVKYLVLQNEGLVVPEDLMLLGSSTKKNDDTKIGMFGSGWKFALSWLFRNGCVPTILSGGEEIKLDFKVSLHRGTPVRIIQVNNLDTSITTEFGKDWEGWMALREIISNSIDEGGFKLSESNEIPKGIEGVTQVAIPISDKAIKEVLDNFDSYFKFDTTPTYRLEDLGISFYKKKDYSPTKVFRKGILCYEGDLGESIFDISFDNININESRITTANAIQRSMRTAITSKNINQDIIENLFNYAFEDTDKLVGSLNYTSIPDTLKPIYKSLHDSKKYGFISMSNFDTIKLFLQAKLLEIGREPMVLPSSWITTLENEGFINNFFDEVGIEVEGSDAIFDFKDIDSITAKRMLSTVKHAMSLLNLHRSIKSTRIGSYQFSYSQYEYLFYDVNKKTLFLNYNALKNYSDVMDIPITGVAVSLFFQTMSRIDLEKMLLDLE